jgi:hypothetical protein
MAATKDKIMCWLVLLLFATVYKVCLPDSVQAVATSGTESKIVERVSRRQNNDVYFFGNSSSMRCDNRNVYLVSEDQCVKDQELFESNNF